MGKRVKFSGLREDGRTPPALIDRSVGGGKRERRREGEKNDKTEELAYLKKERRRMKGGRKDIPPVGKPQDYR